MKKVSIKDMAASLNLSRNTITKALADSESVAMDTKLKVVRKALEMGYTKIDPGLVMKLKEANSEHAKNIVVLVRKEDNFDFWIRVVNGISDELSRNHYNLVYCCVGADDVAGLAVPPSISKYATDGIIVLHVFDPQYIEKLREHHLPMVFLDAPGGLTDSDLRGDVILIEGETAIYGITKHLIRRGCTRLGFIGDITFCKTMNERWRGFQEALRDMNIPLDPGLCCISRVEHRYYQYEGVKEALDQIGKMPQAIVCANDKIAGFVYKYLRANGYNIPRDVMVSGFDDTADCEKVEPHLTSVHINNEQIGRRLAEEMLWRIRSLDQPYETIKISTKIIFRESTG